MLFLVECVGTSFPRMTCCCYFRYKLLICQLKATHFFNSLNALKTFSLHRHFPCRTVHGCVLCNKIWSCWVFTKSRGKYGLIPELSSTSSGIQLLYLLIWRCLKVNILFSFPNSLRKQGLSFKA